jgi:tetratricopeptide (TPR) repeat protein
MKKLLILLLFIPILFSCNEKDKSTVDEITTNTKDIILVEKIVDTTATNFNDQLYSKETVNEYFSRAKDTYANANYKGAIVDFYKLQNIVNNSVMDDESKTSFVGYSKLYIGIAKYELKDFKGAVFSFDDVIEIVQEKDLYQSAIFWRGMANFAQHIDYLYFQAIEDFTTVIELPQFAMISEAYYFRAAAKYRVFDRDGACEDAKKSEELGNSFNTEIFSYCGL